MRPYEFDSLGRLSKITNEWLLAKQAWDQETDYSCDSQGRRRRQDNANGTWTLYDYDAYGRLARPVVSVPALPALCLSKGELAEGEPAEGVEVAERLTNYASDATTMSEFGYRYSPSTVRLAHSRQGLGQPPPGNVTKEST